MHSSHIIGIIILAILSLQVASQDARSIKDICHEHGWYGVAKNISGEEISCFEYKRAREVMKSLKDACEWDASFSIQLIALCDKIIASNIQDIFIDLCCHHRECDKLYKNEDEYYYHFDYECTQYIKSRYRIASDVLRYLYLKGFLIVDEEDSYASKAVSSVLYKYWGAYYAFASRVLE